MLTVLSLCDYSGVWSAPWKAAGYDVVQVDLQHGVDVRLMQYLDRTVYAILAAPPCTMFCKGSAHLWAKRSESQMLEALSVVDACLRMVAMYRPAVWALENPSGQLNKWLGPPSFSFHPSDFGDPARKLTHLWGTFRQPNKISAAAQGTPGMIENAPSVGGSRQNTRSETPPAFAQAFYDANTIYGNTEGLR